MSPLENAVGDTPDPEVVRILLDAGARVPGYALYQAIRRDSHEKEILQMLIEAGVDVNGTDPDEKGRNPLQIAAGENKPELVAMLMQTGTDPLPEDLGSGDTAFDWSRRKLDVLQAMIDNGLDLAWQDEVTFCNLLHRAIRNYHRPDTIRILIERGIDVNAPNHNHNTPLHSAAWGCEPGVITTLYEAGADPGARNINGDTALDITLFEKNREAWDELIKCLRDNPLQNAHWWHPTLGLEPSPGNRNYCQ
ncbi:MAG: ankyrin repeat domain-containing protein [Rhodobacteraceae bacterium]|nr:ankyrin repeat domain-containing protein [Paracoccaceae bacterium]